MAVPRWIPLLLAAAGLAVAAPVLAQDNAFGFWTPADGSPITQQIADRIPVDGGECMVIALANTPTGLFSFGFGGERDNGLPQHPEFLSCMKDRGWRQVDSADYRVLRIQGQAQDCLAKPTVGCAGVVNAYLHGVSGAKVQLDMEKGLQMARTLCERGEGDVCLTLASVYMHGAVDTNIKMDQKAALQWADKGCDLKHAPSCGFAGVLLYTPNHAGIKQDPVAGKSYLKKACDLGMHEACDWPRRPEDVIPESKLPGGYAWCKYVLATSTGVESCPDLPVTWTSTPQGTACTSTIDMRAGNCRYQYTLGK